MWNLLRWGTQGLIYPLREEEIHTSFIPGTSNVSTDYWQMQPMSHIFLKLTLHEVHIYPYIYLLLNEIFILLLAIIFTISWPNSWMMYFSLCTDKDSIDFSLELSKIWRTAYPDEVSVMLKQMVLSFNTSPWKRLMFLRWNPESQMNFLYCLHVARFIFSVI